MEDMGSTVFVIFRASYFPPAVLHGGGSNLLYADSRVEWLHEDYWTDEMFDLRN